MPSTTESLRQWIDAADRVHALTPIGVSGAGGHLSASFARAILAELEALHAVAEKAEEYVNDTKPLTFLHAGAALEAALAHLKTVTDAT